MNAAEKVRVFSCNVGELEALCDRARAGEDIPADELEETARALLAGVPTWDELASARRAAGLSPVTFTPEVLADYVNAVRALAMAVAPEGPCQ
ncbi:MAG: hypothetical protein ACYDBY_16580 [Thermoanaerobaculia bacterium]